MGFRQSSPRIPFSFSSTAFGDIAGTDVKTLSIEDSFSVSPSYLG